MGRGSVFRRRSGCRPAAGVSTLGVLPWRALSAPRSSGTTSSSTARPRPRCSRPGSSRRSRSGRHAGLLRDVRRRICRTSESAASSWAISAIASAQVDAGLVADVMGLSTLGIGLLPRLAQIGVWAPALLVALRLMQGNCARRRVGRCRPDVGRARTRLDSAVSTAASSRSGCRSGSCCRTRFS